MYNFDVVHVTSQTIRLFYYFIYYYVYRYTLGENIEKKPKSIFFSREEFKAEKIISCTTLYKELHDTKCSFDFRCVERMKKSCCLSKQRTIKIFFVICWNKPRYKRALTGRGKREGLEKWLDVLLKPSRGFTAAARSLISKKPPYTSRRSTSWIRELTFAQVLLI